MKRLLLIALIALISVSANAQKKDGFQLDTVPLIDGAYQFQEVVNVDSTFKKDLLYKNARIYFLNVFNGAKDAFQYESKQEGKIIGKGFFSVTDYNRTFPSVTVLKWDVNYNTEIVCKDGIYRLRFYNILITKEYHVAADLSKNVHLTVKDVYDAIPQKRGPYKTLYPKVFNKMIAEIKTNIDTLKGSMIKRQSNLSAGFN